MSSEKASGRRRCAKLFFLLRAKFAEFLVLSVLSLRTRASDLYVRNTSNVLLVCRPEVENNAADLVASSDTKRRSVGATNVK